ncbi:MAG: hypothetical protein VCC67_10220, partial [Myxococcota bacterium]
MNRIRLALFSTLVSMFALAGLSSAGDDQPKYRFSSGWFTKNIPIWQKHLGHLSGRPNLTYLEIGPYEGQSFFWVVDNFLTHPTSRATAIDIFAKGTSSFYHESYETV